MALARLNSSSRPTCHLLGVRPPILQSSASRRTSGHCHPSPSPDLDTMPHANGGRSPHRDSNRDTMAQNGSDCNPRLYREKSGKTGTKKTMSVVRVPVRPLPPGGTPWTTTSPPVQHGTGVYRVAWLVQVWMDRESVRYRRVRLGIRYRPDLGLTCTVHWAWGLLGPLAFRQLGDHDIALLR